MPKYKKIFIKCPCGSQNQYEHPVRENQEGKAITCQHCKGEVEILTGRKLERK